jgi:hypothetical protein
VVDRWLPPAPVAVDQTATRAVIGDAAAFRDALLHAGFEQAGVEVVEEKVVWRSAEELVARCMSWWDLASRVEVLTPEKREAFMDEAIASLRREHPGAFETDGRNHVAFAIA